MIFVTVGTQLPFDRLLSAVDTWVASNRSVEVFAQTGPTDCPPAHMAYADFVTPTRANELFMRASLIVSHAGMGSILTALKYRKSILILPREARLGEHRNDHQLATAKWLGSRPGVTVAWRTADIGTLLDQRSSMLAGSGISDDAAPELIEKLQQLIHLDHV